MSLLEPSARTTALQSGGRGAVVLVANTLWYLWTFRRTTIERLLALGFRIVCVGQSGPAQQRLLALGCHVEPLEWRLASMNPIHEFAIVRRLTTVIREHRPCVAFSFTIKANLATSLACRASGVPYATNVSGLGTAFLRDDLKHRLIRLLFGLANGGAHTVFFQNPSDLALFRDRGLSTGARCQVLPGSGVDTDYFAFAPPRPIVRTFVMIARLIRDKGVMEYLQAARALRVDEPHLRFLLVGPANVENAGALSSAEIAAYDDAVEYLGELDDVRAVLQQADCLVLPSYREGMPKVVLEAASVGRMAIVADAPGCRDAIDPDVTGMLCAVRSASDLAKTMRAATKLSGEEILAISMAARKRVVEHFHIDLSTKPYLALAEALSSRR